jgi:hypothetical protein
MLILKALEICQAPLCDGSFPFCTPLLHVFPNFLVSSEATLATSLQVRLKNKENTFEKGDSWLNANPIIIPST